MKRFLSMLAAICFLLSGIALTQTPQNSQKSVSHQKGQKHKAHKATKHKAPKRSHTSV